MARARQIFGLSCLRVICPQVPNGKRALGKVIFRRGEPIIEVAPGDAQVPANPVCPWPKVLDAPLVEGPIGNLQFPADVPWGQPFLCDCSGGRGVASLLAHQIRLFNVDVPLSMVHGHWNYMTAVAMLEEQRRCPHPILGPGGEN